MITWVTHVKATFQKSAKKCTLFVFFILFGNLEILSIFYVYFLCQFIMSKKIF